MLVNALYEAIKASESIGNLMANSTTVLESEQLAQAFLTGN